MKNSSKSIFDNKSERKGENKSDSKKDSKSDSKNDSQNDKGNQKKRVVLKRTLLVVGVVFLLGFLGIGGFIWWAVATTPQWDPDKLNNPKYASIVYDKDGNEIAQLSSQENRLSFQYEDLPELLVKTIVALEDKNFYDHVGFDPVRVAKSAIDTVFHPEQPVNSSTLTIKLARNTLMEYEDSGSTALKRKIQEANMALKIERSYAKSEILTAYLSHIYFGHGTFGVRSAARAYFGKDLNQLSVSDIAMLCGLPAAPSGNDPYVNPERAKERRTVVLGVMRDEGLITAEEFEQYKDEPFSYIETVKASMTKENMLGITVKYPYFVDYVISSLLVENGYNLAPDQVYNGGLHIYTTVDPTIQQSAEEAMKDPANFPLMAQDGIYAQGAMVMLDNFTGDVIALVGGRDYPEDQKMAFNRASDGKRQPGSVAMPLIAYAPALEHGGYDVNTVLDDAPLRIGIWSPRNADGIFRGPITMGEAFRLSVNIYAIKLYQEVGPEYCWNFARNQMGLELENTYISNLSNALGAFEATPLEIALAYASFPNQGVRNEPRCVTKIIDVNGTILQEPAVQSNRVMKESTALAMNDLLRTAVTGGTGQGAAIDNWDICGMTGITDSGEFLGGPDAWFAGYSPAYTAAVWMGYDVVDKNHHLTGEYANRGPVALWKKIMRTALENRP